MDNAKVFEYKCPCCNAALRFREGTQQLSCEYCGNSFDLEAVKAYNESQSQSDTSTIDWDGSPQPEWAENETASVQVFQCPACGGEILTDENTAATFCPFCDNPTILPGRLGGALRPNAVLPFQKTKEDAKEAFLGLCKGKPLLPREFLQEQSLEKITGIYVPFWLYDCGADFQGSYRATRVRRWSDSRFNYTRTEHFLLLRGGGAEFQQIPMDGSSKMDDTFMESIEPFDFGQLSGFDMRYLSGFFADKYDVPSENGEGRIRQRVEQSLEQELSGSFVGFSSVLPTSRQLHIRHSKAKYVLLPVWMLNTRYRGKLYTFAMNGQTGKMTGSLPISPKWAALWFIGVWAGVAALVTLAQLLF